MKYLRVKNWEEFQQYKDRDPKWIKLHRDLLDDYEFELLDEVAQIHLVKIWLLAAKLGNRIPNDPKWVQRKIGARSKVDLEQLVTHGFILPYESVRECTKVYLETEEETEEETEAEAETHSRHCPYEKIVGRYHERLSTLPRVVQVTDTRRAHMRQRWRNGLPSLDAWDRYFEKVADSDFLMGRMPPTNGRKRPFMADFDWLINPTNVIKVIEGKYDG